MQKSLLLFTVVTCSFVPLVLARDVLDGIKDLIPSYRGVKFSGTDLLDFGQCMSYSQTNDWSVLFGVDEVGLHSFSLCSVL